MQENIHHLGANLDTRPPEEAAKSDIHISEVVASAFAVDWKEIDPAQIRVFGVQNQQGKSDCVAETRRKLKRIMFKVNKGIDLDFSSVAFYRKRSNFPSTGMIAADAISLDANNGMTLDLLVPSDSVTTETDANNISPEKFNDEIAKVFATKSNDVIFTPGDLETIASTIQTTRKGVMIWIYGTVAEWSMFVPQILTNLSGPSDPRAVVVHSVTGIEPALYQGKKGLWIDDSAHFGGLSRRFITEEFFKARNWFASYPIAFKFETPADPAKPKHTFNVDLEFSPVYNTNPEVVALQDCLKYSGDFPTNVASTGYFGALTLDSVQKFQVKNNIVAAGEPGYGRVGPKTREKLNELFS